MKHLLLTTIAAVLLVGCCTTPSPEPPKGKAPDISIHRAAQEGNIEAVKQHLAAGTDVDAKNAEGLTPLHKRIAEKELAELLIANGADVNAKCNHGATPLFYMIAFAYKEDVQWLINKGADVNAMHDGGKTPLDTALLWNHPETAALLRKHGGKTSEELKAEGK